MKKLIAEYYAELPPNERFGYFKYDRQREKCVFDLEPETILVLNEPLAMMPGFDVRTMIGPDRFESFDDTGHGCRSVIVIALRLLRYNRAQRGRRQ